ncbi:MAG: hypothetical protein PHU23_10590 [Dehalococcoidales bacterium]|nr:hypothetical protein [Dehalococcoidales bacterium]
MIHSTLECFASLPHDRKQRFGLQRRRRCIDVYGFLDYDKVIVQKNSAIFYGYVIVICSFLILIVTFGTLYSFGVFFNRLRDDLGWTAAVTSTGYSMSQIFGGIAGIITGRLSDKFSPRLIVLACGTVLAPASLFGLLSLGAMVGMITFIYTFGGFTGPIFTGYIFDTTGSYQSSFIIFAAISAAALILVLTLRTPGRKGN